MSPHERDVGRPVQAVLNIHVHTSCLVSMLSYCLQVSRHKVLYCFWAQYETKRLTWLICGKEDVYVTKKVQVVVVVRCSFTSLMVLSTNGLK